MRAIDLARQVVVADGGGNIGRKQGAVVFHRLFAMSVDKTLRLGDSVDEPLHKVPALPAQSFLTS